MIWYEWKRIWQSRLTQFAVIGCILFLLFCTWSNIRQIQTTDGEGNQVTGMAAVKALKETERITLDQETVTAIMQEYLDYTENPDTSSDDPELQYLSEKMYRTWYLPNRNLLNQICGTYIQEGQGNMSDRQLFEGNLGKDFYEARKERVQERLTYYVNLGSVTPSEADWWDEQDDKVGEYTYGNYKVWEILIGNLPWVIFIMMVVCVGRAPVFAGEYQSKCDSLLLCMKHGKHRLILAKLTASFVYASVLYWGDRVTVLGGTSHFRGNGRMGSSCTADLFGNAVQLCPHHESGISSRPSDGICDDTRPWRVCIAPVSSV